MTGTEELDSRAHRLLSEAAQVFRGHEPAESWLRHHLDRLAQPLRLAVLGPPRSGKSTLVNALIGEDLAPVRVDGDPRLFTWFQDGPQPFAQLSPSWGAPYPVPITRSAGGLRLSGAGPDVHQAIVAWPSRVLRRSQLIDTPGLLPGADGERIAERAMAEADAVLYLTRRLGDTDLDFLRLGRGNRGAAAFPVQLMVVLSRTDETAGGRTDALLTAKQIARRRRREPRVAALCQDVLATSPLIAHAGRTLRDDEYDAIAALAELSRPEAEPHLLSADRFVAADFPVPVAAERRSALLDRLGLGGVRLATTLVRTGSRSRTALSEGLLRHSGLTELQAAIADLFADRRATLKARAALIALDQVLRTEARPQSGHLVAELERLVAGAHEFRELRLLAALRTRRVTLPADRAVEARRLAGGYGTSVAERLDAPPETPPDEIWTRAFAAAERWRAEAGTGPTAAGRRAAEVVLRSCTAILSSFG